MTKEAFEGPFPIFFTNSAEVFPDWFGWADNQEPCFYAVLRPVHPNPLRHTEDQRYECTVLYGGGDGGRNKYRGNSFRPTTRGNWAVYGGGTHPGLGKVIHDGDMQGAARELSSSQIEKISSEDKELGAFFEEARKLVPNQDSKS